MSKDWINVDYNYGSDITFGDNLYLIDNNADVISIETDNDCVGLSVSDAEDLIKELQEKVQHFRTLSKLKIKQFTI